LKRKFSKKVAIQISIYQLTLSNNFQTGSYLKQLYTCWDKPLNWTNTTYLPSFRQ